MATTLCPRMPWTTGVLWPRFWSAMAGTPGWTSWDTGKPSRVWYVTCVPRTCVIRHVCDTSCVWFVTCVVRIDSDSPVRELNKDRILMGAFQFVDIWLSLRTKQLFCFQLENRLHRNVRFPFVLPSSQQVVRSIIAQDSGLVVSILIANVRVFFNGWMWKKTELVLVPCTHSLDRTKTPLCTIVTRPRNGASKWFRVCSYKVPFTHAIFNAISRTKCALPYPARMLFSEASRGLERKLPHIIWRQLSFQFLLTWRCWGRFCMQNRIEIAWNIACVNEPQWI